MEKVIQHFFMMYTNFKFFNIVFKKKGMKLSKCEALLKTHVLYILYAL